MSTLKRSLPAKYHLANEGVVARDGVEVLDYGYRRDLTSDVDRKTAAQWSNFRSTSS